MTDAPRWRLRRRTGLEAAALGGLPAAVGHADVSPEWQALRAKLFGDRPMTAAPGRVQPQVPLRAAYGASVPVKLLALQPQSERLYLRRLHLLVDKNPSPLAAVIQFTPESGQADLETRLRVNEYSHVRVVAEWTDGELHTDSRCMKVPGGCSAPPNRDALPLLGQRVMRLPEGLHGPGPTPVDLSVVHPNDTGFELNQQTLAYVPPHFVRSIQVSYQDRPVFDADLDFSIAENPSFRFRFLPRSGGELRAEVEDSKEGRFSARQAVPAPPA